MTAKDAIKEMLVSTQNMMSMLFSDLSDADLLVRPVPSANHIAWQMGHLIESETGIIRGQVPTASYPELPEGIKGQGSAKTSATPPAGGYLKKADYLEWFNKVRAATLANLDQLPDAELDRPSTGAMKDFAPTVGAMFILVGHHTVMHSGQFSVVRRALNKPVLF